MKELLEWIDIKQINWDSLSHNINATEFIK